MEHVKLSTDNPCAPRKSRFPPRDCVRKGCGQTFLPATWNQTCCQAPECLREVRNWQARKRQQKRRERPRVRAAEASAAKAKRQRRKQEKSVPIESPTAIVPTVSPLAECASLRSTRHSGPICDRVGCYDPPRVTPQCDAAYCSHECRDVMRRVRDRERKYFWRRTAIGRLKCGMLAGRRRNARQSAAAASFSGHPYEPVVARAVGVHPHGPPPEATVGCGDRKEDLCHDIKNSEATVASQSRPPPT